MMHEDKQKICDLLLPALQATRNLDDLINLQYDLNMSWCRPHSHQDSLRQLMLLWIPVHQ